MARDDFDDAPLAPTGGMGPLDGMFRNTNVIILVIFSLCCGIVAFILGLIGMLTAKDPKAKSNATLVVIISAVVTLVNAGLYFFSGVVGGAVGGNR